MSTLKRPALAWTIGLLAVVTITVGGVLSADTQARLRSSASGPAAEPLTEKLPPVAKSAMKTTAHAAKALSVLSFDDGTCESGLGAGARVTDLVEFDVPTQCIQSGLDIVGLTARMNTGSGTAFAFAQGGAAPPGAGAVPTIALATALSPLGACRATALSTRAIGPGVAVITGTSNFFAGLVTPSGFAGRDSNGPPAGRIWLNCAGCGMTQYTPTDLANIGFADNWMIRVTVEDANCVPVELMEFTVGD